MKRLFVILLTFAFLLSTFTVVLFSISAQEETWVELLSERTRTGKKFQGQIDPDRFRLDLSIGAVHYDGPNWKEIDNTLVPSTADVPQLGLADWEMTQDDYEWFALETLNTVPMWLFRNRSAPDSYITFNPQSALQWTNDLDQISTISSIVPDTVGQVSGNSLHWENAYGLGRNLTLFTSPNRMVKHLMLDSYPGDPPQFILDGGNASLELRFIFDTPSGPNQPGIFVNGVLWDRRDRVQTAEEVEFRVGGETLFYFAKPFHSDTEGNISISQMVLTRQGGNVIVGVRVPHEWLLNATYPVTIDPTIDLQVQADADDGTSTRGGQFLPSNYPQVGKDAFSNIYDSWFRFTGVGVAPGNTIDVAYASIQSQFNSNDGSGTKSNLYMEDDDDAAAPTSESDHAGKNRTSAFTAWDDYHFPDTNAFHNSPSIVSAVQEVIDRTGWTNNSDMQVLWDDDGSGTDKWYRSKRHEDTGGSKAAKLHIEYSTATATCQALTVVVNNPADQMYFNGTTDTPTGGLWQEENVSEDFQTAVTPAMNVTNDDGSGACDVTLELLTSPGSGRTMKWSLTSTAPNPGVNSIPVGSNTTAVSSLGSGSTQAIYLWVDYDDSQGGSATPTLRVDTELP